MKDLGQFRRCNEAGLIGGICAGIAYYFNIPAWMVRLVFAFFLTFFGVGLVTYIFLYFFMPKWIEIPEDFDTVTLTTLDKR